MVKLYDAARDCADYSSLFSSVFVVVVVVVRRILVACNFASAGVTRCTEVFGYFEKNESIK